MLYSCATVAEHAALRRGGFPRRVDETVSHGGGIMTQKNTRYTHETRSAQLDSIAPLLPREHTRTNIGSNLYVFVSSSQANSGHCTDR